MNENKGNRVEYSTFFSWRLTNIIGCKKTDEKGKTYNVKVWCKVCAEHKSSLKVVSTTFLLVCFLSLN